MQTIILTQILSLIFLGLNQLIWRNSVTSLILSLILIISCALGIGQYLTPSKDLWSKISLGLLTYLGLNSILLTGGFYLASLPIWSYWLSLAITTICSLILTSQSQSLIKLKFNTPSPKNFLLGFGYYATFFILLWQLFQARTEEIIFSPWQVASPSFFLFLLVAIILLIALTKNSSSNWKYFHYAPLLLLILRIGVLVYKHGYGFDPFIHEATERWLLETATISPKPLYYVGTYVITNLASIVSGVSLSLINQFLPSLLLVCGISIMPWRNDDKDLWLKILALLFIPAAIIVTPTPQAVSLAFLIAAVLFANTPDQKNSIWVIAILAIGAILSHPLTGLLAIWALIYSIFKEKLTLNLARTFFTFSLFTISLVSLFVAGGFFTTNSLNLAWNLANLKLLWLFPYGVHYKSAIDIAYLIGNLSYFIILLSVIGYLIFKRKSLTTLPFSIWLYLGSILASLIALTTINFTGVINYEGSDLALRLWQLAPYLLLPLLINISLPEKNHDSQELNRGVNPPVVFAAMTIIVTVIMSNVYMSYPRYDDYQNSKLLNVSKYDFAAVQYLEGLGGYYAVLANQMTSVAALKLFSFERLITLADGTKTFLYPIPTSSKYYEQYINVLYSRDPVSAIIEAKKYTGKNTLYLILNGHWSNYAGIDLKLKPQAQWVKEFGREMTVYKF